MLPNLPSILRLSHHLSKPRLTEGNNDTLRDGDFPTLVAEWGLESLPREHKLLSGGDVHAPRGALGRFSGRRHVLEGAGSYPACPPPQKPPGFYAMLQLHYSHGIFIIILGVGGGKVSLSLRAGEEAGSERGRHLPAATQPDGCRAEIQSRSAWLPHSQACFYPTPDQMASSFVHLSCSLPLCNRASCLLGSILSVS